MNAKQELLDILQDKAKIKCAQIGLDRYYQEDHPNTSIILKQNHTKYAYNKFLNQLDFEYDNGYGGQELFGIVWLKDKTWITRGEYDGSEYWEHNKLPKIPEELL